MRTFYTLLSILLLASPAFSSSIPFGPSEDAVIQALQVKKLPQNVKGVARGIWDVSTNNNGSSSVASGLHDMGATLPAAAIITDVYGYVVTRPATTGEQARVSFECEDARNLLDGRAVSITGKAAGEFFGGRALGSSSTGIDGGRINSFVSSIGSGCIMNARVESTGTGKADFSAGRVILYVEYSIAE